MTSEKPEIITTVVTVSTVYPGPGGGAIFTGQDTSDNWIRAKANYDCMPLPPIKGQVWELKGEFISHDFYGIQLHVQSCRQIEPTGKLLYSYLRHHPAFRGIGLGDGKIAKLYHRFGDGLNEILERGDRVSLTEVLTEAIAEKLVTAWQATSQESSVISFLSQNRIDVRIAHKVLRYWGAKAVENLRENPYRLLGVTTWENADRVARNLGFDPLSPLRLVAATEAWGYRCLDKQKNTKTDERYLRSGIRHLIGRVDDGVTTKAIELALEEKAIVGDPASGYQPVGCALMEGYLVNRFRELLPAANSQMDLFGSAGSNKLVDDEIEIFERREGLHLNTEQRRAIHMAATCSLSVLKGGAGVGKTTVLKVIHQVIRRMNRSVHQMALAGRAAQRMREATNEGAYTIIGFLNHIKNSKVQLRIGDLIIIDESSMLDLLLTYRLIKSIPKGVRLLFVGDPFQLPPIGPGLIFHILANSAHVPTTELTEVHRQAASTGIPQIALHVRNGVTPSFMKYEGLGCGVSFIECQQAAIVQNLERIINDLGHFHDTQILGVIKSGVAGVTNINTVFHQLRSPAKPCLHGWGLAEDDPVIFTTNDYERELFNGSLGIVEEIFPKQSNGDNSRRLRVNFDGRKFDMSSGDLGNVELAYAITVHKAQGSQFRRVVIPITKSRLLDRTLIYTALTRSVEQVVFVGDKREFCLAVERPPSACLRQVGFFV